MAQSVTKTAWLNLAGSAAVIAVIALVGSAEARQDPQGRKAGEIKGSVTQKGRDARSVVSGSPAAGIAGGAVAGIVVARTPEQTACSSGTASACRAIESGLSTGGAWSFADGGIMAMDDWEVQSVRTGHPGGMTPAKMPDPPSTDMARGNHIPSAVLTHRVLAACDAGDVSACSAFASSVRPATASERTEQRTYTAGR